MPGEPPTTSAGGVLVNGAGQAANAVPKTSDNVPSNATYSTGDSNEDASNGANSGPTQPVYNPSGAARAATNSGNWSSGSLSETVANIAGPNPEISYTDSGKTIYTNPTTGNSVVYDNAGNYYRVTNAAGQYLDQSGNPMPNNVPLVGPNKTTQTGVPSGIRQALTHYNNTDPQN